MSNKGTVQSTSGEPLGRVVLFGELWRHLAAVRVRRFWFCR